MLKVLVIDDEVFVRKGIVMETDWASLDCMVAGEAANGLEGLEACRKYNLSARLSYWWTSGCRRWMESRC